MMTPYNRVAFRGVSRLLGQFGQGRLSAAKPNLIT
jgi:hypothetical protein